MEVVETCLHQRLSGFKVNTGSIYVIGLDLLLEQRLHSLERDVE